MHHQDVALLHAFGIKLFRHKEMTREACIFLMNLKLEFESTSLCKRMAYSLYIERPRRVLINETVPPRTVPQMRSTMVTTSGQFLSVARLVKS